MDYKALKKYRNETNPFAKLLGIVLEDISHGSARAVLTIDPENLSLYGSAHGGCLFTLADLVSGAACSTFGYVAVTATATYNYLRSARLGDVLTGTAVCTKQGRHLSTFDVSIVNQEETLLGTACFTYYLLDNPIDISAYSSDAPN